MQAIKCHVINLERRPDRRRDFERWNADIPGVTFTFSKAVDGEVLDVADVRARGLLAEAADFRPGHLASSLSQRLILLQACSYDTPTFVCEDDAVFRADIAERWRSIERLLPNDWDLVLFGYNFDSGITMDLIPGVQSFRSSFDNRPVDEAAIERFRDCVQPVLLTKLENAFGLPAYAVSPAGAARLLNTCFPMRNEEFFVPCLNRHLRAGSMDSLMNNYYRNWQAFATFPPLVLSVNDKAKSDTDRTPSDAADGA